MIPMLLKLVKLKRGAYNKLISILLKFIADKGRAISLPFRILNLDEHMFYKMNDEYIFYKMNDESGTRMLRCDKFIISIDLFT